MIHLVTFLSAYSASMTTFLLWHVVRIREEVEQ